jgi:hypothetical protein
LYIFVVPWPPGVAQRGFEFREDLLDRVQVGVGQHEQQAGVSCPPGNFMAPKNCRQRRCRRLLGSARGTARRRPAKLRPLMAPSRVFPCLKAAARGRLPRRLRPAGGHVRRLGPGRRGTPGVRFNLRCTRRQRRRDAALFLTLARWSGGTFLSVQAELAQGLRSAQLLIEISCAPSSQAHFRRS